MTTTTQGATLEVDQEVQGLYVCPACGYQTLKVKRTFTEGDEKKVELECGSCDRVSRHSVLFQAGPKVAGEFDCEWCKKPNKNRSARGQHMRWCDKRPPGAPTPKRKGAPREPSQAERMMAGIPTREELKAAIQEGADRLWLQVRFHRILADQAEKAAQELEEEIKSLS